MKLSVVCGVLVLLNIVSCFKHHHKKEHDLEKKHHSSVKSPPLTRISDNPQKDFKKYMNKWQKFSQPETKWQVHIKGADKHPKYKLNFHKEKKHTEKLGNLRKNKDLQKKKNGETRFGRRMRKNPAGALQRNRFNRRRDFSSSHKQRKLQHIKDTFRRKLQADRHNRMNKFEGLRKDTGMRGTFQRHHPRPHQMKRERDEGLQQIKKEGFLQNKDRRNKNHSRRKLGDRPFNRFSGSGQGPWSRIHRRRNGPDGDFCKRHKEKKCTDAKREVCGSDGKTYQNACLMLKEACKDENIGKGMKMEKRGACDNVLN